MSQLVNLQNVDLLDQTYEQWKADPRSVSNEWASFFEGFELGCVHAKKREHEEGEEPPPQAVPAAAGAAMPSTPAGGADDGGGTPLAEMPDSLFQRQVDMLIYSYRDIGHRMAHLDPLSESGPDEPLLAISEFGFAEEDLDREVSSKYFFPGRKFTLRGLIEALRQNYSNKYGAEFMYIQNPRVRHWVRDRIESGSPADIDSAERKRLLRVLLEAEGFESFLHTKYIGQKRFSLEGGESLIVILDTILQNCGDAGIEEIVMGMAHRGRLNVLANFLHKSPEMIFNEFSENYMPDTPGGDGDVKYHLGYQAVRTTNDGREVEIRLSANPSHLEAVDPVVQGKARARQRQRGDTAERKKVVPLLIHGDAAFAGQGIVAEVFNMSQLPGYRTGGTLHIIVNNQIGFTTLPADARSTHYCTDVARMIEAPIFHVNGDDPLAVAYVTKIALDYRQQFSADVIIDMYCYRKHGHNEGDEPVFTQPNLYRAIEEKKSVSSLFHQHLVEDGTLSEEEVREIQEGYHAVLDQALEEVKRTSAEGAHDSRRKFSESTAIFQPSYSHDPVETAITRETLEKIVTGLTTTPETFNVLPKIQRILLDRRREVFEAGGPYDWSYGEALAFGALLLEGTPVRLSGQDSRRGTFSQRHSVLYDEQTRDRYIPLLNLAEDQARFCVYNSLLSEAAVLGFDYGYSLDYPDMLCLWEAQFGDFANGAQVIIDQFIVSAEAKWQHPSGIVMLLPHGYEGQGPEHSSARLERFLQMCARDNIQVCYPTTPAQYFHLLRRQALRGFKKPLVVMTPKSLLRLPAASSMEEDFTGGTFREVLDSPMPEGQDQATRVIFCSGKIYYELADYRKKHQITDTALVRIEQLYPFNEQLFVDVMSAYPAIETCVWCQEEPQNMGAWNHIGITLSSLLDREICYAGRSPSASPAAGSLASHRNTQAALIEQAFEL